MVDIPLDLSIIEDITSIGFTGRMQGTFFLDDIRMVAATPPGSSVSTAIDPQAPLGLPQSFDLRQNYPNPFNSATAIPFSLPQSGQVELAVYNLAGQKVVTLASGRREAGTHVVRWDSAADDGRPLASGVYLYRLKTGERTATRRLLLLR